MRTEAVFPYLGSGPIPTEGHYSLLCHAVHKCECKRTHARSWRINTQPSFINTTLPSCLLVSEGMSGLWNKAICT